MGRVVTRFVDLVGLGRARLCSMDPDGLTLESGFRLTPGRRYVVEAAEARGRMRVVTCWVSAIGDARGVRYQAALRHEPTATVSAPAPRRRPSLAAACRALAAVLRGRG